MDDNEKNKTEELNKFQPYPRPRPIGSGTFFLANYMYLISYLSDRYQIRLKRNKKILKIKKI